MTAAEYNTINELVSQFSALNAALEGAEAEIKTVQLAAAQPLLPKHAAAKIALADLEAKLRKLADDHYGELFPKDKREHKTPFGALKYTKSASLEYDDEEVVCLRIHKACDEEEAVALKDKRSPLFTADQLLRTRIAPNLEALESQPDGMLTIFGIRRMAKDNFKVVPFEMKTSKPAKKKGKPK
jgi:hypothetical protein